MPGASKRALLLAPRQLAEKGLLEIRADSDQGLEDVEEGERTPVVDVAAELRAARSCRAQQGGCGVRAQRREGAVVARQRLAHARTMIEPGPKRRDPGRPDVGVQKAGHGRALPR